MESHIIKSNNTWIYSRVSTNKQDSSTEQQELMLQNFLSRKGITEFVNLQDSDVSGKMPIFKRPQGRELLNMKEGDTLVCVSHDRLFRNFRDGVDMIDDWLKQDIKIYLLNISSDVAISFEDANVEMQLYFLMLFSHKEARTIAARTKDNMKFRKENGKTYSSAPYGYDNLGERGSNGKIVNGKLIPNEREQVIISQIKAYRNHNLSLGKIAEDLNNRKIPSKKGGKWSAKTVADVINNSLNNIESV